jgi:hypothetical protein
MNDWSTPFALHVAHASGATVTDVDGNSRVDFCLGDTGAMFGHAAPAVAQAVAAQMQRGCTTMLATEDAAWVGEELARRFGLPVWQSAMTASDATIDAVKAFATTCGKNAVEVADRAGFIVNALLFPYLNNAVRMLENGVASRDDIDTAMKGGCNFPMGPLALLDLVGLDTSVAILDALYDEFRDPNYAAVPRLRRMVTAGHLGRKSGQGFFDYRK